MRKSIDASYNVVSRVLTIAWDDGEFTVLEYGEIPAFLERVGIVKDVTIMGELIGLEDKNES